MRLFGIALLLAACGTQDVGTSSAPIVAGVDDTSAGPVVLIIQCSGVCAFTPYLNVDSVCSGTLIGPNLVLTARHCVAPQLNADNGVLCSKSSFGKPWDPTNFVVTPAKDIYVGGPWYFGSSIAVDPTGDSVCGHDVATLHLAQPYVGASPMVPRLQAPPVKGEKYTAVGYGDDLDGGLGFRHRREGLTTGCVAGQCKLLGTDLTPLVDNAEFMGETGLCGGDSGGPAIDQNGLLFGVTSRGSNCTLPVYSRVDLHASFIQSEVVRAAVEGSYEVPAWAFVSAQNDAGADAGFDAGFDAAPHADAGIAPTQASGGCSTSRGSPSPFAAWMGVFLAWVLRSARRRSKSPS